MVRLYVQDAVIHSQGKLGLQEELLIGHVRMMVVRGNIKEEVLQKAFITAWNYTVQNRERLLEYWKQMIEGGSSLEKIRGKQMIELTKEGKIDVFVPELMQMVLEMIEVHDLEHFTVCFLDGTKKEILV